MATMANGRVSPGTLDPNQAGCFVRPDLGPNCLLRFMMLADKELTYIKGIKKRNRQKHNFCVFKLRFGEISFKNV